MTSRQFKQVDVFTNIPYWGNPVAVVLDGTGLSDAAPPTQRRDVPPDMMPLLLSALGLTADQVLASQILNNGPEWWCLLLDSVDTVQHINPDHLALKKSGIKVGVAALMATDQAKSEAPSDGALLIARSNRESRAFHSSASARVHKQGDDSAEPTHLEVRAFAAAIGILEDPVTGSLNASLAQWLIEEKIMPRNYVAGQGHALGRQGRVHIQQDAKGQVWVGGDTAVCIEGHVALD